jgi:hypothetical protein
MKLLIGFTEYPAATLMDLAAKVAANSGGAVWTGVAAQIAAVAAAALVLSSIGPGSGPGHTAQVRLASRGLADALNDFAVQVNETKTATDTDVAALDLPTAKDPVLSDATPDMQSNLVLSYGQMPGTVFGKFTAVGDNNRIYEAEWTLDPVAGPWTRVEGFTNTRKFLISDLVRGKDIYVRVRARNTKGAGPWSDVATIMVT